MRIAIALLLSASCAHAAGKSGKATASNRVPVYPSAFSAGQRLGPPPLPNPVAGLGIAAAAEGGRAVTGLPGERAAAVPADRAAVPELSPAQALHQRKALTAEQAAAISLAAERAKQAKDVVTLAKLALLADRKTQFSTFQELRQSLVDLSRRINALEAHEARQALKTVDRHGNEALPEETRLRLFHELSAGL